jgi:hypothetical protein
VAVVVQVAVTQVGGKQAKVADSEGGGIEQSRAGDNKDKYGRTSVVKWRVL